ncbi:MAG: radical SAM protein [Chitinivibrionales bacterium]|nr:radical SAM protein [Chitinivibrionales bacterium]MBD3395243.1 radical SAM protein [Chitinivibrionales bacterium]
MQAAGSSTYSHLFGPVPSRRLGISLGIDLVPRKTCSLNCVYCECGATTDLTTARREYVPFGEVVSELDRFLADAPKLDVITFAGSGEPTLHSRIGDLISHIKKHHNRYRIAVLTNGTLLHRPDVRGELMPADLMLPSLDAVSPEAFEKLNRPAEGITAKLVIDGIRCFADAYRGALWIEVFIVPGTNDSPEELGLLKQALSSIRLARVQLNTLDRPGAVAGIAPSPPERLREIAAFLSPLPVEIIARNAGVTAATFVTSDITQAILSAVRRRPCTVEDLASMCGRNINEINKVVGIMLQQDAISAETVNGQVFYASR